MEYSIDISQLKHELAGQLVGSRLLHFDEVTSTMDTARRLAEDGTSEGTVVLTERQTAGRGRFARPWYSSKGQDILFSVVLRPALKQLPSVNMAATLAVCTAATEVTTVKTTIKWPNDVRIDGRKVAGILIESAVDGNEPRFAIVGIGVNVNLNLPRSSKISLSATSLSHEADRPVDRTELLLKILTHFNDLYSAVRAGKKLTERWAERIDTLGHYVKIQCRGRILEGRADGVDDQGNLVLSKADGTTVTVIAGEVTLQI